MYIIIKIHARQTAWRLIVSRDFSTCTAHEQRARPAALTYHAYIVRCPFVCHEPLTLSHQTSALKHTTNTMENRTQNKKSTRTHTMTTRLRENFGRTAAKLLCRKYVISALQSFGVSVIVAAGCHALCSTIDNFFSVSTEDAKRTSKRMAATTTSVTTKTRKKAQMKNPDVKNLQPSMHSYFFSICFLSKF